MKIRHLIIVSALICTNTLAESTPGDALLNYFGATCSSLNGFTNAALNDSRALMETLRTLRDDEDCKSVAGAISQLNNLENKLIQLDQQYYEQVELAKIEAQEIELLAQLGNTIDPVAADALRSALSQVQLDKASMMADEELRDKYNGDELRGVYTGLIKASSSAYDAITKNQLCLDKNPALLSSATSLVGSIAASAVLVNPALGLGIAGLSDFIGNTVDYYRNRGYNSSIKHIANKSTVSLGLTCALETLTNRQCDVQDAKKFLEIEEKVKRNARSRNPDTNLMKIKEISELFDKDLPVFIDWLDKVKAGAPAANTSDAGRKTPIFYEIASIQDARNYGEGLFAEKEKLFQDARTKKEKFAVIKEVLDAIMGRLPDEDSARGVNNPLTSIYRYAYAPYYLMGISLADAPKDSNNNIRSYRNVDILSELPDYEPNLVQSKSLYENWVTEAQDRVNRRSALILQPDPITIISDYADRSSNKWKRSPRRALFNIKKFLIENAPDESYPNRKEMFASTKNILVNIEAAIPKQSKIDEKECDKENSELYLNMGRVLNTGLNETTENTKPSSRKKCDHYAKAIETISSEAKLEFGNLIIKNRLEIALRVAINYYIERTDVNSDNENQLAQFLAAESFLDALRAVKGQDNLASIQAGLMTADQLTQDNLESFSWVFAPRISYNFWLDRRLFNHADPAISGPRKKNRAKICFLLGAIPEWPNNGILKYCEGLKLQDYEDGPETPVFNLEYINRSYADRRCVYRDYIRKNKIYKDWGIKL